MSNNAMWSAKMTIHYADGQTRLDYLIFMAPDLKNTKLAKKRAAATAKERTEKKYRKVWSQHFKKVVINSVQCVG